MDALGEYDKQAKESATEIERQFSMVVDKQNLLCQRLIDALQSDSSASPRPYAGQSSGCQQISNATVVQECMTPQMHPIVAQQHHKQMPNEQQQQHRLDEQHQHQDHQPKQNHPHDELQHRKQRPEQQQQDQVQQQQEQPHDQHLQQVQMHDQQQPLHMRSGRSNTTKLLAVLNQRAMAWLTLITWTPPRKPAMALQRSLQRQILKTHF